MTTNSRKQIYVVICSLSNGAASKSDYIASILEAES
jgi:hypothetical protein